MPDKHRVILWVKRNVLYVCPAVCIGNHSRSVDWHVIAPQILALGNSKQKSFVKYVHIAISGDGGIRTPVQNNPSSFRIKCIFVGFKRLVCRCLVVPRKLCLFVFFDLSLGFVFIRNIHGEVGLETEGLHHWWGIHFPYSLLSFSAVSNLEGNV